MRRLAVAVLPAAFFTAAAIHYLRAGTPWMLLWVCNVCNLVLAIGLALRRPRLVWIATSCLLVGLPLWLLDVLLVGGFQLHSFFTHFVAALLGLASIRRVPRAPGAWWQAMLLVLALQALARAFSPPADNVMIAWRSYHSLARVIPSFPLAWLLSMAAGAAALWLLERLLARVLASACARRPGVGASDARRH